MLNYARSAFNKCRGAVVAPLLMAVFGLSACEPSYIESYQTAYKRAENPSMCSGNKATSTYCQHAELAKINAAYHASKQQLYEKGKSAAAACEPLAEKFSSMTSDEIKIDIEAGTALWYLYGGACAATLDSLYVQVQPG